jgi:hypothetical protein
VKRKQFLYNFAFNRIVHPIYRRDIKPRIFDINSLATAKVLATLSLNAPANRNIPDADPIYNLALALAEYSEPRRWTRSCRYVELLGDMEEGLHKVTSPASGAGLR